MTAKHTPPQKIYLTNGDAECEPDNGPSGESFSLTNETSWCQHRLLDCDMEYIRADLHDALKRDRDMLREALEKIKEGRFNLKIHAINSEPDWHSFVNDMQKCAEAALAATDPQPKEGV